MQIIVNPYEDPSFGLDWHEQTSAIFETITNQFVSRYGDSFQPMLRETNHGTAADWPTVTITVTGLAGAFFIIPEAHKRVREAFEEWKKIGGELSALIVWLSDKFPVVSYPKELLFFDLLEWFEAELGVDANELQFIELDENFPISQHSFGTNIEKAYLFTFRYENMMYQIAVNNRREVIWKHHYKV